VKNFIGIYDNSIDDDLVNDYLNYWDNNQVFIKNGMVGHNGDIVVKTDVKDSQDITSNDLPAELIMRYQTSLQKALNEYLEEYKEANHVSKFKIVQEYNFQCYPPGGGFKTWHHELAAHRTDGTRHLVFMTYLNTIKDGGTEFLYQNLKVDAVKGRTVIWPPGFTHTHRGVICQEPKAILTGWWSLVPQ